MEAAYIVYILYCMGSGGNYLVLSRKASAGERQSKKQTAGAGAPWKEKSVARGYERGSRELREQNQLEISVPQL